MKELYSGKQSRQMSGPLRGGQLHTPTAPSACHQSGKLVQLMRVVILLGRGVGCRGNWRLRLFPATLTLLHQAIRLSIANATARIQTFRNVYAIHNQAHRNDRPLAAETSMVLGGARDQSVNLWVGRVQGVRYPAAQKSSGAGCCEITVSLVDVAIVCAIS